MKFTGQDPFLSGPNFEDFLARRAEVSKYRRRKYDTCNLNDSIETGQQERHQRGSFLLELQPA